MFLAPWARPVVCEPLISVVVYNRGAHSRLLSTLWSPEWNDLFSFHCRVIGEQHPLQRGSSTAVSFIHIYQSCYMANSWAPKTNPVLKKALNPVSGRHTQRWRLLNTVKLVVSQIYLQIIFIIDAVIPKVATGYRATRTATLIILMVMIISPKHRIHCRDV